MKDANFKGFHHTQTNTITLNEFDNYVTILVEALKHHSSKHQLQSSSNSIFVCYSHADITFAKTLSKSLYTAGFKTWVDYSQLKGGQQWLRQIQEAIDNCAVMLVILSPDSIYSEYVESEYHYAYQSKKVIIPLDYRICKMPMILSRLQLIDFRTIAYEQSIQQLFSVLRHYIS